MLRNPFGVMNPEDLDAEYISRYFVDMFTDLPKLQEIGNTFIHGARGTGKSMLLRSLEASIMLKTKRVTSISTLPHVGIHVPLRKVEFGLPELTRPKGLASTALGEHMLIMHILYRLARLLGDLAEDYRDLDFTAVVSKFEQLFSACGGAPVVSRPAADKESRLHLSWMERICESEAIAARQFVKRLAFAEGYLPYSGPLAGFLDFLIPLAGEIWSSGCLPKVPLFVMLDDADNLPKSMQRLLNSWVSTRTTHIVCLKVTTQLGYATWRTLDNRLIESPHDFSEVDIGSIYTSSKTKFSSRVAEIVTKRLKNEGIDVDPNDFFPRDSAQIERIEEISTEIRKEWLERKSIPASAERQGGTKISDDVSRYAVPRFMRELAGASRSSHTFSYAGFDSMVDLSSGVVRWFLEPACRMYDEVVSRTTDAQVQCIPVGIQDTVINAWSREFAEKLTARNAEDEEGIEDDASLHAGGHEGALAISLRNLIDGLGQLFRLRLLDSNASEQRAFSVVVRGEISRELQAVLDFGVRLGYLQRSDNAAKEAGASRRPRYILARRLGPHYQLDVSGYAAHLSVTADALLSATRDPKRFAKSRAKSPDADGGQLTLLNED